MCIKSSIPFVHTGTPLLPAVPLNVREYGTYLYPGFFTKIYMKCISATLFSSFWANMGGIHHMAQTIEQYKQCSAQLPIGTGRPDHHSVKKCHHSAYKSVNFDHEIMEICLICSNLVEKKPPFQQSWAEPCNSGVPFLETGLDWSQWRIESAVITQFWGSTW
jgi:hypothetical protein